MVCDEEFEQMNGGNYPPVASEAHAIYNAALAEAVEAAKQNNDASNGDGARMEGKDFEEMDMDSERNGNPGATKEVYDRLVSNEHDKGQSIPRDEVTESSDAKSRAKSILDNGDRGMANAITNAITLSHTNQSIFDNSKISNDGEGGGDEVTISLRKRLREMWEFDVGDGKNTLIPEEADNQFQNAYNSTLKCVSEMVDSIMQDGLHAYHQMEHSTRELELAKETIETKNQELQRLRESDESQRKTISNLLRAVEKSKSDAKHVSQVALQEARMRSELTATTKEKDDALNLIDETMRKHEVCKEELRQTKGKLSKVEQDKAKLERDRRATMSWAKSVDSHMSSDCAFYKRKVRITEEHVNDIYFVHAFSEHCLFRF